MAKNRAGREIWYERNFLHWTPVTTEGFVHLFLTLAVIFALWLGGEWLTERVQPALKLVGGMALVVLPIWIIANLIVVARHSGGQDSSWKN